MVQAARRRVLIRSIAPWNWAYHSSTPRTSMEWDETEELVGLKIKNRRDQVVLATKFGVLRAPDGSSVGVKVPRIMCAPVVKQV